MTPPIKYAFSGDRNHSVPYMVQLICAGLAFWKRAHREKIQVVVGDARGLDAMVRSIAPEHGLLVDEKTADWDAHGKAAGAIRNQEIIDSEPKILFVLKDDFGKRRNRSGRMLGGSEDCARRAIQAGIPVFLIRKLDVEDVT